MNGPTYNISIVGSGVTPALDFSFTSHDFGACFIHRAGLPVPKKVLTITNNDTKEIRLVFRLSLVERVLMIWSRKVPPQGLDYDKVKFPFFHFDGKT